MSKVHDRIVAIAITCDEGDDTVVSTAVYYYRNRAALTDSDPEVIKFTAGDAAANHELELGQLLPPPTHIRLVSTFQA